MLILVSLLGCNGDASTDTDGTDVAPTDTPTETGGPTDTTDTDLPTSCDEDPSLTVQASAATGPMPNTIVLTVTTSSAALVAATCTNDQDPTDVHLAEGVGAGTSHELRFQGLLQDTDYTCRAVSTCPESSAPSAPVAFTSGHASEPLPELRSEIDPTLGMTGHYTLAPWLVDGCLWFRSPTWLVLWDERGRPRWWWPLGNDVYVDLEALYDPATGLIGWGGGETPRGAYNEIHPWDGVVYEAALPDWDGNHFSHDGHRHSESKVLTLQTIENHDRGNTKTWDGFGVRVLDPTRSDEVTLTIDSQRYYDEGVLPEGGLLPPPVGRDPYHANSVQWLDTPRGPEVYVALCYAQQILAIDPADGSVIWQLGAGKGWTVTDADGSPLTDADLPQCQHGTEALGDDRFLIYDNGQLRGHSSVAEWRIDGANRRIQRLWYWTEADWNEPFLGDADALTEDRVLLTQASVGCPEDDDTLSPSRFTEVDRATGRVASRLTFPELTDGAYRSQRIDGCGLFQDASACPAVAERIAELAPLFE